MATIVGTNILSGTVEVVKYAPTAGVVAEIYQATTTTALANGDIIQGPTLPAGCYLTSVKVGTTSLDSSTGSAFTVGYAGHTAIFYASQTIGRGGGTAATPLAGIFGFTATTDTQVNVYITATATTAVAGTVTIIIEYTASP